VILRRFVIFVICGFPFSGASASETYPVVGVDQAPFPTIRYTATYEDIGPGGENCGWKTVSSNGGGQIYSVTFDRDWGTKNKYVIEDYIHLDEYTVNSSNSSEFKTQNFRAFYSYRLTGVQTNESLLRWSFAKHGGSLVPAGEKFIDGHRCRGWKSGSDFALSNEPYGMWSLEKWWFDKDTGCLVLKTEDQGWNLPWLLRDRWETRLKKFEPVALGPEKFLYPSHDTRPSTVVDRTRK
jgi:hypothetical protein